MNKNYRCCKKHCMYVGKDSSQPELLRTNCPCGKVIKVEYDPDGEEVEVFLQPICFLQVLKELRYDFGYVDASVKCETDDECCHNEAMAANRRRMSNRPKLDLNEVMFCQNSQSILDNTYSRPLRDQVGCDGWESVHTVEQLGAALNSLYWYRRFASDGFVRMLGRRASRMKPLKRVLAQCFHTLNGLLAKKFLCLPCEMEGYKKLAEYTAGLFEAVFQDYTHERGPKEQATPDTSIILRMKETFKIVKMNLVAESREERLRCLLAVLELKTSDPFARFFGSAFKRLEARIASLEGDYTTSVAWLSSMSQFSQTRNLGYLPEWVALEKRAEYRRVIGRDKVPENAEHLRLVYTTVQTRQRDMGVPLKILEYHEHSEYSVFVEAINGIRLPLRGTASERSTVREGGKVEDARQLMDDAIRNKWKVPVRNLKTGRIDSWLEFTPELRKDKPAFEGYLFWTALQVVVNRLLKDKPARAQSLGLTRVNLPGSESWEDALWNMTIVHISEPGKERNLTKSSSLLGWVLTICSKVSQMLLSNNQDHRAGLVLSAQDWMHQRRVSSESFESGFIYENVSGIRRDTIWNGFQDWTESTDFIRRMIGTTALKGWLDYIAFPDWYKRIILVLALADYEVTERLENFWSQDVDRLERTTYRGRVTEGFMMGNPLTKTILHLMHDVNIGVVHLLLARLGISVQRFQDVLDYKPVLVEQSNQFYFKPGDAERYDA